MELSVVKVFAEGYHSGAVIEEEFIVSREKGNELEKVLDKIDYYVYELNGKHSETLAEVTVESVDKEEAYNKHKDLREVDSFMHIADMVEELGIDLHKDVSKVEGYLLAVGQEIEENKLKYAELTNQLEGLKTAISKIEKAIETDDPMWLGVELNYYKEKADSVYREMDYVYLAHFED